MTDTPSDAIDADEGYTRYKGKFQLGNGPDARGEVTVEFVRGVEHDEHGAIFGEYVLGVERSVKNLRDTLGLPDDGVAHD